MKQQKDQPHRYGRLLAYVFVDGVNFNLELVRKGLSPYYTKYGLSQKYDKEFREAERYARKHKLNIWGDPGLTQKYLRLKSKWGQHRASVRPFDPIPNAEAMASVAGQFKVTRVYDGDTIRAGVYDPQGWP